ncbi:MAG: tetratricopeptide repeat protein [Chthoniobacterales bacterium]
MKALALCLAAIVCASVFAEEPDQLARAVQPLEDGIPQVAVVRLRELLTTKLPDDTRRVALLKLAESLVASGQAEEATQVASDALLHESHEANFLRAQALAALGRWDEALPLYKQADDPAARFGEAEALRALGRTDEALQAFAGLTSDPRWSIRARFNATEILLAKNDLGAARRMVEATIPKTASERKERRLLRGRIEWREKHSQRAIDMLASVLKRPKGATHAVLLAGLCAIADAHLERGTPDSGDDYLEDYIEHRPEDSALPFVFAKLDQLYAAERRQSRHELGRWSREQTQPRRALAQWYLARAELRLHRRDAAVGAFEQLRSEHPTIPEIAGAYIDYASLVLHDGDAERARAILEATRPLQPAPAMQERIDLLIARAEYQGRQFRDAAQTFWRVAQNRTSRAADDALLNASFAWLSAGDATQAASAAQDLNARGADEQTRGDVALEAGLVQAARNDKAAAQTLQKFVHDYPKHPRVSEAWVALAELAFRSAPPGLDEARQDLARAAENQPTPAAIERADYLNVWLEGTGAIASEERVIFRATDFLQKHGNSPLAPDVRLKLAETHYSRHDFASAQTQFELLAQENPNGAIVEKAEFFAAKSAMNSMGKAALDRALVLFDQVVKRNGELKWPARNEQAVIERKLGKSTEALTLYDEVLKGDAKPADKREALCGKGDIFYELGTSGPENYKRAVDVYNQLVSDREASPHWRNQAIFKKGMCLEKLNAAPEALAAFYGIVEDESRPDRRREFFWFYKAGFNAARLLEEQSKWQAAAAVYEKLAFAGGARSEEAKSRLDRLRLEHFLWDE